MGKIAATFLLDFPVVKRISQKRVPWSLGPWVWTLNNSTYCWFYPDSCDLWNELIHNTGKWVPNQKTGFSTTSRVLKRTHSATNLGPSVHIARLWKTFLIQDTTKSHVILERKHFVKVDTDLQEHKLEINNLASSQIQALNTVSIQYCFPQCIITLKEK